MPIAIRQDGRVALQPFCAAPQRSWLSVFAASPVSGLRVQAIGDAHISNFGVFASPERRLMFDVNDFDETLPGPWEMGRQAPRRQRRRGGARERRWTRRRPRRRLAVPPTAYRQSMRAFSADGTLDVWYAHLDVEDIARARLRVTPLRRSDALFARSTSARTQPSSEVTAAAIASDSPSRRVRWVVERLRQSGATASTLKTAGELEVTSFAASSWPWPLTMPVRVTTPALTFASTVAGTTSSSATPAARCRPLARRRRAVAQRPHSRTAARGGVLDTPSCSVKAWTAFVSSRICVERRSSSSFCRSSVWMNSHW